MPLIKPCDERGTAVSTGTRAIRFRAIDIRYERNSTTSEALLDVHFSTAMKDDNMPFDESLAFKRDPYRFITKRCRQIASDVCETLGVGGVQSMDGAAHQHRKAMFLALMSSARIRELAQVFRQELLVELTQWQSQECVVLYDALQPVLTRAVCKWSAVPLAPREIGRRTKQLTALFDAAGRFPGHFTSRLDRMRAEDWAAGLIENVRLGAIVPPAQTALREIALHRDLDGQLLSAHTAAVELLNVLRPTVAVSVYIVFCAHALHQSAQAAELLRTGGQPYMDAFISEVRRFYPFFPAIPTQVRQPFCWDERVWQNPETFHPQRFLQWNRDGTASSRGDDANAFVPQGGGSHPLQHRCPGEWITVALMRTAIEHFTQTIRYNVPAQDLSVDATRRPALPRSRFVISAVRPAAGRA